jgi:hypothetical protein
VSTPGDCHVMGYIGKTLDYVWRPSGIHATRLAIGGFANRPVSGAGDPGRQPEVR